MALQREVPAQNIAFLDDLNPEQRKAVVQTELPLLILAGAGSGKTRVITHRIAYLVAAGLADPGQILAVTFTNKAAEEMRNRVGQLLHSDCQGMWIATFHSFCARLLRREAPVIGLSRDFVIYDTVDQISAVKQVIKELSINDKSIQPRQVLSRISQAKNRMESPEALRSAAWNFREEQIAKIFGRYVQKLHAFNALDFDDLLLKSVELFEQSSSARTRYSRKFRFVMVDEYQDTNRPQYLLLNHLTAGHRRLCVVGDPDQSIYRWRGADLRNILDFENDFPEAQVVRLEQNYRSTQLILDAASAVIQQNRNRKEKGLWTEQEQGKKIIYFRAADDLEEADFITRATREALSDDTETHVAILYRTNAQSRVLEDAFMREGLAYRMVGGVRFYERKEIKDVLAFLKLIINPYDDVSLRRVINVPTRGIGKGVMASLQQMEVEPKYPTVTHTVADTSDAATPSDSLWSKLIHAVDQNLLSTRATSSLSTFKDLLLRLQEGARNETVPEIVGQVLDQTGYLTTLRDEQSTEAEGRIENLMELVSAAQEAEHHSPDLTLASFVDRLSLLSETDEGHGSLEARAWMMTLHAAKGLEFPTIVISGLEEGLFPHAHVSEDEEDVEEERRLFYVGLTRAQRQVLITGAARRRIFGEYQFTDPSRFVDEIPSTLVDEQLSPSLSTSSASPEHDSELRFGAGAHRSTRRLSRKHSGSGFSYEDEDQSLQTVRPGSRVRHPLFGVGTVTDVEEQADDLKVTVRFTQVGSKKLLARYAKLELA